MIKVLRPLALACALSLTFALTGCSDTSWIEKVDGVTVTPGMYIAFMLSPRENVLEQAAAASDSAVANNPWSQTISSTPAVAWVQNQALQECGDLAIIEELSSSMKVSLSSSEENVAVSTANADNSQYSGYALNGVSTDSLKRIVGDYSSLEIKLFNAYYGPGGKQAVSDTDLKTYFGKNYVRIEHIVFKNTDASGNALPTAQAAQVKAKADQVLKLAKAGKGANFTALMNQYSDDKTSGKVNDPAGYIFSQNSNGQYSSDPYDDTLISTGFTMKVGDIQEITASYGYDVMYKVPLNSDMTTYNQYFTQNRQEILQEMKSADFQTMIDNALSKAKIQKNQAAINKYTPQSIKDPSEAASTASTAS